MVPSGLGLTCVDEVVPQKPSWRILVLALGISAEAYGVPGTIWGEPCRRLEQYLDFVGMFDGREFGRFFFSVSNGHMFLEIFRRMFFVLKMF